VITLILQPLIICCVVHHLPEQKICTMNKFHWFVDWNRMVAIRVQQFNSRELIISSHRGQTVAHINEIIIHLYMCHFEWQCPVSRTVRYFNSFLTSLNISTVLFSKGPGTRNFVCLCLGFSSFPDINHPQYTRNLELWF